MTRSNAFVHSIAIAVFISSISTVAAQSRRNIRLGEDALAFAAQLIKEGRFIADRKGAWTKHRASAAEENEFIRAHGFREYAKWHLGIDRRFSENSKRRYKFPYGDFTKVHRCGLLAVKARARQYGYLEIENAATKLEQLIEQSKSGASTRTSPAAAGSPTLQTSMNRSRFARNVLPIHRSASFQCWLTSVIKH